MACKARSAHSCGWAQGSSNQVATYTTDSKQQRGLTHSPKTYALWKVGPAWPGSSQREPLPDMRESRQPHQPLNNCQTEPRRQKDAREAEPPRRPRRPIRAITISSTHWRELANAESWVNIRLKPVHSCGCVIQWITRTLPNFLVDYEVHYFW